MALKKKKEYKNGTSAEYHNIASILITPTVTKEKVVTKAVTDEERSKDPFARTEFVEKAVEKYTMAVKMRSYVSEKIRGDLHLRKSACILLKIHINRHGVLRYEAPERQFFLFYPDRTFGCDCHYRHSCRHAAACFAAGTGKSKIYDLSQQS